MAPAHPHVTLVAVYPALFFFFILRFTFGMIFEKACQYELSIVYFVETTRKNCYRERKNKKNDSDKNEGECIFVAEARSVTFWFLSRTRELSHCH